jgi:hypothetical protein
MYACLVKNQGKPFPCARRNNSLWNIQTGAQGLPCRVDTALQIDLVRLSVADWVVDLGDKTPDRRDFC